MKLKSQKIILYTYLTICLLSQNVSAQTAGDAFRMSSTTPLSTARSLGLSGAMGALGGDLSAASSNPAGIGIYQRSELSLSPLFHNSSADAMLKPTSPTYNQINTRFGFSGGFVFTGKIESSSSWKNINFALGVNRLADFNQRFNYRGTTAGSIVNRFLAEAENGISDPFGTDLAIETYAVFRDSSRNSSGNWDYFYNSDFTGKPTAGILREEAVQVRGSISEMVLTLAGNYNDKLQVGATLGIPFVTYTENRTYKETDENSQIPYFERLTYNTTANTTGAGVNLKIGLIARPIHHLRFGLAIHSPTFWALKDSFSNQFEYVIRENNGVVSPLSASSPDGIFSYIMVSPWRLIGSMALVAGKYGFVSADAEYTNYSQPRFLYDTQNFNAQNDVNTLIKNTYQANWNVRVGAELVLAEILRLRGGFSYRTSPTIAQDLSGLAYSGGFGIRTKGFFFDLGYRLNQNNNAVEYSPYQLSGTISQPRVAVTTQTHQVTMTLGFRF